MNNSNFDADDVKPVVIEADPASPTSMNALDYGALVGVQLASTTGKMCMTSTDDVTVVDPKFFEAVDCKGAFGGSAAEDNRLRAGRAHPILSRKSGLGLLLPRPGEWRCSSRARSPRPSPSAP